MLSEDEIEAERDRWAEEVLALLNEQRPSEAERMAWKWKHLIAAEEELEERRQQKWENWTAVIKLTIVTTIIAGIAAAIWGPSRHFVLIIPSWIVVLPIYWWLKGKFKKKLNRRNEA